ncbi:LLM class flavin-dependent oxidoreductase [Deinococcus sp. KSM4-11]|uniref:LLM class flavin-dependent oxidoreductase n=1 Tax=Deinococcus sp. KSM4-11 TaxID=2568654 RepID=UPI0010A37AE6|nr:LLM class flavin-dependent oxidoreductase [Deinococcus sp. KSM4-11]THF87090.1 LLM class flavin-dependent oxidoreductase [Deinococcus sp. KSM4-11]
MQIGIDSFAAVVSDPVTGITLSASQRLKNLIEEIVTADQAGVDSFGVGEHHRQEYLDSAPSVILAAAASRTERIRLTSAVTVLSAADPVRVFQEFATLDLLSGGRAEIIAGRGSFTEAFPLFGLALQDYDSLFAEHLDLLLKIRDDTHVHWSGQHRAALTGQGIYPRPAQDRLPIWLGVGGTPQSFVRAGLLGLPLMVAIIGGDMRQFRPLIDLYREASRRAGHAPETLKVGVHLFGFVAPSTQQALDLFYPGYARMLDTIGRERGWSPPSRAQFDASTGPGGPYLIGDPQTVAQKVLYANDVLGGIDRLTFQMTNVLLPHAAMLDAITLLGANVIPLVQQALAGRTATA